jgi:hypothetical protein
MEAILAIDTKNGIAKDGAIPWKSKKDMSFFYNKTKNNVVIMGKNTYFSLHAENRPLKHRLNIVLTNSPTHYVGNEITNKDLDNVIFTNNVAIYKDILENREKYHCRCPALSRHFKNIHNRRQTSIRQIYSLMRCGVGYIYEIRLCVRLVYGGRLCKTI